MNTNYLLPRSTGLGLMALLLATSLPGWASGDRHATLQEALTHHASFDQGVTAEFSRGDPVMRGFANTEERKAGGIKATLGPSVEIMAAAGKFGGALRRETKHPQKLFYHTKGILDYDKQDWSGTVSVWLRISPDVDLEPGFCDPVMFMGSSGRDGLIFVEWSAAHSPRKFRYAVRPRSDIWNPEGVRWEEVPAAQRPMVQVEEAPFSRDHWTHVVFSFDRVNAGQSAEGRLYLDGKLQGRIADWDLTFGWTDADVILALGVNYIGFMDDLAVFDRALTDGEVAALHDLAGGVEDLY